ncbi:MAG: ABC transporter substrate-binding protein, partial [Jaaginema sp. PMC 1079.18]|nr:ABC transporter substrate-binding protein [Jaaginema sp. PMC 1079.18]
FKYCLRKLALMFNFVTPFAKARTLLIIGLTTFLISFWIHGCSNISQKLQPLRIGISSWPGFDIVLYAQEAGIFKKRGLEVELLRFESQQDSMRAMMRGSLDAVFSSLWDTMQVDSREGNPAFIMVTNVSNGSDGIVATPEIKSVSDLVGKTVGVKLGSVEHLIFLEALELHNIDPKTVTIDNVLQQVGVQKIKQGQLDASVTWEPSLSEVAKEIDGNIIFTTQEVDSLVIDGLIAPQNNIATQKKALTQLILSWFDLM